MTWVKIDDGFFRNPKVRAAGRDARDLYLAALCYANENLTDGFVPAYEVKRLAAEADIDSAPAAVKSLCDPRHFGSGLWAKADGGYQIHDYHDYQPKREDVLKLKETRAAAGSVGGRKATGGKHFAKQNAKQNEEQETKHDAEQIAKQNANPVSRIQKESGLITYDYAVVSDAEPPSEALSEVILEGIDAQEDGQGWFEEDPPPAEGTAPLPGDPSRGDDESAWDQLRDIAWGSGRTPEPPPRPGPVSLGDALRVVTREAQPRRSPRGR